VIVHIAMWRAGLALQERTDLASDRKWSSSAAAPSAQTLLELRCAMR